jgi:hypothetical protein
MYEAKRQAMMKKYGGNFAGKEVRLFHGTSVENIEKINAGGLNRNYAGRHGNVCLFLVVLVNAIVVVGVGFSSC